MTKEKRAELLLDHYKDTFQLTLYHWKARNRLFLFILILLALMALDFYSPNAISRWVNAFITQNLGQDVPTLDFEIMGTVMIFLLLTLVIEYYKRSINVDRQYRYLISIEESICDAMDGDYIAREGKSYFSRTGVPETDGKNRRPIYLRCVGPLYTYFFPVILILLLGYKIYHDFPPIKITAALNTIFSLLIIVYNFLYLVWALRKK
ncbi:MAG: hypothetical protein ONB27_03800 [candidate division KSB1 bacterium]|nr:hypothetical protein [candidate division KSB1 bacterium]